MVGMVQTISYSAERVVGTGSFGIVFQVTASVISLYYLMQKTFVKGRVCAMCLWVKVDVA